jgi:hypothetical protein
MRENRRKTIAISGIPIFFRLMFLIALYPVSMFSSRFLHTGKRQSIGTLGISFEEHV